MGRKYHIMMTNAAIMLLNAQLLGQKNNESDYDENCGWIQDTISTCADKL